MLKVLEKTFTLLETITLHAPEPMLPQELARETGINRATCSRLLKELLETGYLIHLSRQRGYLPGPKLLVLNNQAHFEAPLLDSAIPQINQLAEQLKCSALLAQLYGGKRYVLCHKNCNPELYIRFNKLAFDDLFRTATGVMLVAFLPENEQSELRRKAGNYVLPEFADAEVCILKLKEIRKRRFFCSHGKNQSIYAVPVFRNGEFCAALGVSIPFNGRGEADDLKIQQEMQTAAEKISAASSILHSI